MPELCPNCLEFECECVELDPPFDPVDEDDDFFEPYDEPYEPLPLKPNEPWQKKPKEPFHPGWSYKDLDDKDFERVIREYVKAREWKT